MTRFLELLEQYQDPTEAFLEADEFARLLQEDDLYRQAFYDAVMLEVDLYESYAGIAQVRAVPPRRRRRWPGYGTTLSWAVAVFVAIALIAVMLHGTVKPGTPTLIPAAPAPPKAPDQAPVKNPDPVAPVPERKMRREREEDREHGDKKSEMEREYQKELREVERLKAKGNFKEADEKLREIEQERQRKLQRQGRRVGDD